MPFLQDLCIVILLTHNRNNLRIGDQEYVLKLPYLIHINITLVGRVFIRNNLIEII